MTLYQQLAKITAGKAADGYLRAYEADLHKHDRTELEAPRCDRYVWILRGCGTALFPVAVGHDPVWCTYWLEPISNERDTPNLAYLVDVPRNRVRSITYDEARRLAEIPHPEGKRVVVSLS
jgi:hypothetical protein